MKNICEALLLHTSKKNWLIIFNQSKVNDPFLYPLKTSENQILWKGNIGLKWAIKQGSKFWKCYLRNQKYAQINNEDASRGVFKAMTNISWRFFAKLAKDYEFTDEDTRIT